MISQTIQRFKSLLVECAVGMLVGVGVLAITKNYQVACCFGLVAIAFFSKVSQIADRVR